MKNLFLFPVSKKKKNKTKTTVISIYVFLGLQKKPTYKISKV